MVNGNIRVAIFNPQEDYVRRLKGHLLAIDGVCLVGESSDRAALPERIRQWHPDVVILDLDPDPTGALAQAAEVTGAMKGSSVFALSGRCDPKLILAAMRAGMREFLAKPIDHDQLATALKKERERISSRTDKIRGRMVCVVGSCGGAGATTLATNLAVELNQLSEQQVVLVDLDFHFGQVAMLLDLQPEFTIGDLAQSPDQVEDQLLERALIQHDSGVRVLARPNDFEQAQSMTAASCCGLFGHVQSSCGFLVSDGPLRHDPALHQILAAADVCLMVLTMTVTSVRSAGRIMEELSREGFNAERIGLVVNRATEERGGLLVEHIEQTLEHPVLTTIPESWEIVSASINMGRPLATHSPNSPVRQAIRRLADHIHGKG